MITALHAFKEYVELMMKWNGGKIEEADLETNKSWFTVPIVQVFQYTCLPGSSVKRELRKVFQKYGHSNYTIVITADANTSRCNHHAYYIGFKK